MDGRTLEERVAEYLSATGETLATAESCSGGLIAHRITNVAGSSAYFLGGVVAYSNEAKQALLGVDGQILAEFGAVSEPIALQLAQGARARFAADWAVGVTGIAGPSGGTPEKPVGLVYIAVAGPSGMTVTRNVFNGDREEIKRATSEKALYMLLEHFGMPIE